jgi:hypothetical protein
LTAIWHNPLPAELCRDVPPGRYDLSVTKPGFAQAELSGQNVAVGLALTLDLTLQIRTAATTVEVSASADAELQTLNATVGSTISGDSIILLPNLNRDAPPFPLCK